MYIKFIKRTKLILYFLYFLLINFNSIKLINSFELILKIDFNSFVEYNNYECGGSLDVIKENGIGGSDMYYQSNTTIYPPCKSFNDAGERSRQFYENGINYYDVSLLLIIENPSRIVWENYIIRLDGGVKTIRYYCYFEIKVENDPNAVLTIDGTGIYDYFLIYEGYSNGFVTCDSNQLTRVKLSSIKFIDWRYGCLKLGNYNSTTLVLLNPKKPTIVDLSSIQTERVKSFLVSDIITINAQINLVLKDSVFNGMMVPTDWTFLGLEGIIDIENCTFKNMYITGRPLIVSNYGEHFRANKINFINIKSKDTFSFFNIYNTKSFTNNITVQDCSFSNFFTQTCSPENSNNCREQHYIGNIVFINNQIKLNLNLPTFASGIRVFNINKTPTLLIENITIESNNQIEMRKELFGFTEMKKIILKRVEIPKISPQFSASIASNNTNFEIDNHSLSLFNSKVLCIGSSNHIIINVLNNEAEKTEILQIIKNDTSCIDCNINFIAVDKNDGNKPGNSYSGSIEDSNDHNEEYKISDSPPNTENIIETSFNKILIVPIVLSVILILSVIILSIAFRNKIKQKCVTNLKNKDKHDDDGVDNDIFIELDNNKASIDN